MVHYTNLVVGKRYLLGDVKVGKLVRKNGHYLYFIGSEHGSPNSENEIEADNEDDFILLKSPRKSRRGRTSHKRSKTQKRSE